MQPRATLILFVYNQRPTVESAVRSCLEQDCEPIEILISDDASTDGSFELMEGLVAGYRGPHHVRLRRNSRNLGIGEHYNVAIEASLGEILITAAGDDISLPHRVSSILRVWDQSGGSLDLIASAVLDMTASGEDMGIIRVSDLADWKRPEDWCRKRPYVIGATHAFTKRLHIHFGNFSPDLAYEDQVMAFRSCCLGGGTSIDDALVRYRRGGVSSGVDHAKGSQAHKEQSWRRYSRQKVLFEQIQRDMVTANRSELWRGKVKRYRLRSEAALLLLNSNENINVWRAMSWILDVGFWWWVRHWLYFRAL